jgi:hypothetical protein
MNLLVCIPAYRCFHYNFYLANSLLQQQFLTIMYLMVILKSLNMFVCISCTTNDIIIISSLVILSYASNCLL